MSTDPTDPLEAARRENRLLRERVADLERQLKRSDGGAPALDATLPVREALLSEAEHIAHMGSWVWDVPSDSVHWTDELFRILGYDPQRDQASSQRFFDRVHPEDRERVRQASARGVSSGVAEQVDYRILLPDGVVRYVTMNGAVLCDAQGQLTRAVGTVLDVTEARDAARAAVRTAQLLTDAQRIGKMGSFEVDALTGQRTWSEELYRILDVERSQAPTLEAFLGRVHDDDRTRMTATVKRVLALGESLPVRMRIVARDGSVRHLDVTTAGVRNEAGGLIAVRGTVADVTELVQLEAQFHQSQKMQAVGQLAGGLAHDFNNLLMVIVGSAECILSASDSMEARDILKAADAAREITSRLLAFTRGGAESVSVIEIETEVERSRSLLERALGSQIALSIVPSCAPMPVLAGGGQIQQALLNLCLNARDAMPDGGTVTLATRQTKLSAQHAKLHDVEPGEYVVLSVTDTGSGMSEATRARAFEPFFTTKAAGRGTGLGLAMVFGAVKRCSGFVELRSALGEGSTFELWFPLSRQLPDPTRTPLRARGPARAKVLLVDDNESVARVTKALLEGAGYEVRTAGDAQQALATWASGAADLLLSDVEMPGMSGVELSARLREQAPRLPVLFVTGHSTERIQTGPGTRSAVLSKPFRLPDLLAALDALLTS